MCMLENRKFCLFAYRTNSVMTALQTYNKNQTESSPGMRQKVLNYNLWWWAHPMKGLSLTSPYEAAACFVTQFSHGNCSMRCICFCCSNNNSQTQWCGNIGDRFVMISFISSPLCPQFFLSQCEDKVIFIKWQISSLETSQNLKWPHLSAAVRETEASLWRKILTHITTATTYCNTV